MTPEDKRRLAALAAGTKMAVARIEELLVEARRQLHREKFGGKFTLGRGVVEQRQRNEQQPRT